jgi:hypothetical protein
LTSSFEAKIAFKAIFEPAVAFLTVQRYEEKMKHPISFKLFYGFISVFVGMPKKVSGNFSSDFGTVFAGKCVYLQPELQ